MYDEQLIREDVISTFENGFIVKKIKREFYSDNKVYEREIYPHFEFDRREVKTHAL